MIPKQIKIYLYGLAGCLSLYLFSFLGSLFPLANTIGFLALVLVGLLLSLSDLRLGVLMMAMELVLNGKGYLFALPLDGAQLSLRIALWGIVLTVWFWEFISKGHWKNIKASLTKKEYRPLIILAIFILLGIGLGFLYKNNFSDIFFDSNNWLYWLAVLPALYSLKSHRLAKPLLASAITALSIMTVWLLYAFGHDFGGANLATYAWVRDSGLGEITLMPAGYYRVFLQSQFFFLPIFFGVFLWLASKKISWKQALLFGTLALAPIIISLSRSFWLALTVGWLACIIVLVKNLKQDWRQLLKINGLMLATGLLSLAVLFTAVKFPWPTPQTDVSADMLKDRASALSNEAGSSSRWALLPELTKKILANPIIGQGFGATVTYQSADPRILELNPKGDYTTFAFEWGWLDIWLKMGLGGILAYLWLLFVAGKRLLTINSIISISLFIGLICLAAVNIFTPYLNHPLGIGWLIFTFFVLRQETSLAKN